MEGDRGVQVGHGDAHVVDREEERTEHALRRGVLRAGGSAHDHRLGPVPDTGGDGRHTPTPWTLSSSAGCVSCRSTERRPTRPARPSTSSSRTER
ncbi:hypothetical protein [Ornithinimicrobium kibberense]|uniref:hypothetical protein n=1 Tax=Ornithinimicrobium kibberense TaxID=282060 RepID=UPI0036204D10